MRKRKERIEPSTEQEQTFIELYNKGVSIEAIGRRIGLSTYLSHRVSKDLVASGKINKRSCIKGIWNKQMVEEVARMKNNNHTWEQIAETLGVKKSTAQGRYFRYLEDLKKDRNKKNKPKKLWEVEAEARKKGMSYGQYVGGGADSRI